MMKSWVDPYKRGEGWYLVWGKSDWWKGFKLTRVYMCAGTLLADIGRDYDPYAGVMNCIWLFKYRSLRKYEKDLYKKPGCGLSHPKG